VAFGASAEEVTGDRVRVTTSHLDLEGASPLVWGAAATSPVTSVRFTGEADPPQARLQLHDAGPSPEAVPPIGLQSLRFTAELAEDSRAPIVTFQSASRNRDMRTNLPSS
jgi:hypothetical protein